MRASWFREGDGIVSSGYGLDLLLAIHPVYTQLSGWLSFFSISLSSCHSLLSNPHVPSGSSSTTLGGTAASSILTASTPPSVAGGMLVTGDTPTSILAAKVEWVRLHSISYLM